MIEMVFLLLFILLPIAAIILSSAGALLTKKVLATPVAITVVLVMLQLLNLLEVGYVPILIYSALAFGASYFTLLIKKRKSMVQTKTL
ncbi:DUF2651 family protein [Fictibacillus iocasae]|uniref:DUF2651 family protein n=1 Tax=Fictibacillus iocasae TaxID=2715437 RepID=A0ABW2NQ20_9BACL